MTSTITPTSSISVPPTGETSASTIAVLVHAAPDKAVIVDADETLVLDSADSFSLAKSTWLQVWTYIKSKADLVYARLGLVTASGLTMTTGKLLGRGTAATGAVEEITLGTGLSFTGTTLNAAGGTPGGADGSVQGNTAGAFAAIPNFTYDTTTGALTAKQSVTNAFVDGLILDTTNVATAGGSTAQKWSPALTFKGSGWKTNATAAAQVVAFSFDVKPIQGATAPTGALQIASSINGAAAGAVLTIGDTGLVLSGYPSAAATYSFINDPTTGLGITGGSGNGIAGIYSNNGLVASFSNSSGVASAYDIGSTSSTGKLYASGTSTAATSRDGIVASTTTAATAGNQQYSPRMRWTGNGWKTTATAASQAVDFIAEVQPIQGSTNPTGKWSLASQVNAGGYTERLSVDTLGVVRAAQLTIDATNAGQTFYTVASSGGNGQHAFYLTSGAGMWQIGVGAYQGLRPLSSTQYIAGTALGTFNVAADPLQIYGGTAGGNSGLPIAGGDLRLDGGSAYSGGAAGDVVVGNTRGNLKVTGKLIASAAIRLAGFTVATLPAGTQGDTAFVTDANTTVILAFGLTLVGGGANVVPGFYNGTNWIGD